MVKVLSNLVIWYSSANFSVLVGTQYSYFLKVFVFVLKLEYFKNENTFKVPVLVALKSVKS